MECNDSVRFEKLTHGYIVSLWPDGCNRASKIFAFSDMDSALKQFEALIHEVSSPGKYERTMKYV